MLQESELKAHNETEAQEKPSFASRLLGVFTLSATLIGVGVLHGMAQDKADTEKLHNMSDEQLEMLSVAAKSDNCGMIHPRYQRICTKENHTLSETDSDNTLAL